MQNRNKDQDRKRQQGGQSGLGNRQQNQGGNQQPGSSRNPDAAHRPQQR